MRVRKATYRNAAAYPKHDDFVPSGSLHNDFCSGNVKNVLHGSDSAMKMYASARVREIHVRIPEVLGIVFDVAENNTDSAKSMS